MIILGTQYYRPPTPDRKYWKEDLDLMKKAGLNTVQLWAVWGWIEPEPDKYNFDDYDELVEMCTKKDLKVVISTIAEVMPFWVPRIFPESQMRDSTGRKIISQPRIECNVGITPGGCTDYLPLREKMCQFLTTIAKRYSNAGNFIGWDCWNEIRWNVHTDGQACFCPASTSSFKNWLEKKYGNLDGLNKAWKRRYSSWEDVFPIRIPTLTYVENMDWCRFLGWRAKETARWRYSALKKGDSNHPVLAHGGQPSIFALGSGFEPPLTRGNDWDFVEELDGYGTSSFPVWGNMPRELIGMRIEAIKSACRDKIFWASELQGGGHCYGHFFGKPVRTDTQQKWIWNIYARGGKAVIFWCWRGESWGVEAPGFGIIGRDGLADERIKGLAGLSKVLGEHKEMLNYRPDSPQCAVLTNEDNTILNYCAQTSFSARNHHFYSRSLFGYLRALERMSVPYCLLESKYLNEELLQNKKLLILPASFIISPEKVKIILEFLEKGGTLLVEGGAESFTDLGFYNQTLDEKPLMEALGIEELENIGEDRKEKIGTIKPSELNFITKFHSPHKIIAKSKSGRFVLAEINSSKWKGRVLYISTHAGVEYYNKPYAGFEKFVLEIVERSGMKFSFQPKVGSLEEPKVRGGDVWWRKGRSADKEIIFFINNSEKEDSRIEFEIPGSQKPVSWLGFLKKKGIVKGKEAVKVNFNLPAGKVEILSF